MTNWNHASFAVLLLGFGCFSAMGQESRPAVSSKVDLVPSRPNGKEALRWSPKGATVPLTLRGAILEGKIDLGPKGTLPLQVRLERTADAKHVDVLRIDLDRDGAFSEAETLKTTPKETRNKWWSSFEADLSIPLSLDVSTGPVSIPAKFRPYPVALWFVEDPAEPNAAPALRWSRKGWHEGQVDIGGKPALVLITEMRMDGVFDQRDAWAIARDRKGLMSAESQSMEGHRWLDGISYRVVRVDPEGKELVLEPFALGITEAEEKEKKDVLRPDRESPAAKVPLPWSKDPEATFAAAKAGRNRVLVDFETTWCGPCATMNKIVYPTAAVAEAAKGVLAVKVDGDERRDLAKKHNVAAYPTIILFDADGNEIRRVVGYRSVLQMVEFLGEKK